ncbi:MAG: hypothetical protein LKJ69_10270 [Lactobacillus sp.]|jgi:hypothetical protein|nr:hypothetical protein [Lactobacillus sp.]MCI2033747.1 hypothetical protein [Lactobacillus sp.]
MGRNSWAIVAVVVPFMAGLAACGQQAAPKKQSASATVSQSAVAKSPVSHTSASSTPTRTATASEQIALLLLATGAEAWSPTGSQLLANGTQNTAYPASNQVPGTPSGATVYTLTQQHEHLTPLVVLTGDQAYLFAAQSPVPYTYIQQHGFNVNVHDLWQKHFQSVDVAKLAALLPVSASPQGGEDDQAAATSSVSENGISADPETALNQAKGSYIEDDSTISDGSAQRTSFFEQDGELLWEAHHQGDGAMKYEYRLVDYTYSGPDNAGGQIFAITGREYGGAKEIKMTIDIINDQTYTLRSTAINYYGKFNRE